MGERFRTSGVLPDQLCACAQNVVTRGVGRLVAVHLQALHRRTRVRLGEGHAEYKLTDAQLRAAVDGLLEHVHVSGEATPPGVLLALAKSADARVLAPVVDLPARLLARAERVTPPAAAGQG